jgi:hypothetical protein
VNYLSQEALLDAIRDHTSAMIAASIPARASVPATVLREVKPILPDGFHEPETLEGVYASTLVSPFASDLFTPIATRDLAIAAKPFGFLPYGGKHGINLVQRRNTRKRTGSRPRDPMTAPHSLTLRRVQDGGLLEKGQTIVQAIISNGADLSVPLQICLGWFECWCSNQAVSQRGGFSVRMKHVNLSINEITRSLADLFGNVNTMIAQSDVLKAITLTYQQQLDFAARAIPIRWEERTSAPSPDTLLCAFRPEQSDPTLWNTFQNVQRNMLEGGFHVPSTSKSGQRKSKRIDSLSGIMDINTGLDALLEDFALSEFSADLPAPSPVYQPLGTFDAPIKV